MAANDDLRKFRLAVNIFAVKSSCNFLTSPYIETQLEFILTSLTRVILAEYVCIETVESINLSLSGGKMLDN